ncbi:MAG TPA: GNAT family N-acetyltransferase [Ferruginibacter sp.]|nr:GNAT family N-acetyltransferase [Ferruginibacter sp.]
MQYVPYQHIDKQKWDTCISHAGNRLIYAFSFYLDAMARHWDALVLNDYEYVMPLVCNKKYGIWYLYQPPLTASLGVFGKVLSPGVVQQFLSGIPARYRYADIYLNYANHYAVPGFALYTRTNYVLNLQQPYEVLYSNYRENIRRNIKKCIQMNCTVQKDIAPAAVIALAREQLNKITTLTGADYNNFEQLYHLLHSQDKAITYGVFGASGQLLASCIFFMDGGRAYYMLVGNHPDGKTIGASHTVIDAFIKDYAGQNMLLDFEGSDIRNLAFFYSSFGAVQEIYPGLKMNRLPGWLRWLKK